MDIRRVVTGHDANGKAIVVDDELVGPVTLDALPGSEFHQLWGADSPRTFPDDGARPKARSYFPRWAASVSASSPLPPTQRGHPPPRWTR
jgi:hypothetical protein